MRWITYLSAAAVALGLAAPTTTPAEAADDTITMTVTDVSGLEQLRRDWDAFSSLLKEKTGYEVEFAPVTSRTASVELLKSEKVDFILTGPAEFVVMNKLTDAKPVLGFSRPDYFSAIITMADSGITSVRDLKGKKVAVGDVGSTSSHLGPSQLLMDYGIDPMEDVELVHTTQKIGLESLRRGDIAAWGTNYMDDYLRLRAKSDLAPGAFRVIARGPDLPNDVLLAGTHVDAEMVDAVRTAITENSDAFVKAVVQDGGEENKKYGGMKFIANVDSSDYEYVREAYRTIDRPKFAEFVGN
ncbi:PhnD/SsuA/transferrin family substrate-binding protein [Rhodovibrio salinarum]|uniref:Phosphonate ABC transporter substrate-binding protein n=1 Tax=Rhodovibrio salinarum TaxID=1087 RepID=A0A934QL38_9PROT|nr:PhnD/SsuA/transferrin family substrate-binding protein [Rhodovibrio salinarum]MBK1698520.1 phosphonate ABC transporter substrate-binding protein [Rhodovibrio salinarum]